MSASYRDTGCRRQLAGPHLTLDFAPISPPTLYVRLQSLLRCKLALDAQSTLPILAHDSQAVQRFSKPKVARYLSARRSPRLSSSQNGRRLLCKCKMTPTTVRCCEDPKICGRLAPVLLTYSSAQMIRSPGSAPRTQHTPGRVEFLSWSSGKQGQGPINLPVSNASYSSAST